MNIRYLRQSCFIIKESAGKKLITDPCRPVTGVAHIEADIATVSHQHEDHSYLPLINGSCVVLTGAGHKDAQPFKINGFSMCHGYLDEKWLGIVTAYKIEADGISILHLSDIGTEPTDAEIASFGNIDILMVPVGGHYTINPEQARKTIRRINPSVAIPMHYATAGINRTDYPLAGLEEFLDSSFPIRRERSGDVTFDKSSLPNKTEIWAISESI